MKIIDKQIEFWAHMLDEAFQKDITKEVIEPKNIEFPKDEIKQISQQNHIITHRVLDDVNKFNKDDVVVTPWGITYKVTNKYLIDNIYDSPYMKQLTQKQLNFLKDFNDIAVLELNAVYDPPYTLDQIKQHYPKDVYNMLSKDPVHRWRAVNGIELIHKEPDEVELDRIWKNWQLMPNDLKEISDKKSLELFGCTNAEHYKQIKDQYYSKKDI